MGPSGNNNVPPSTVGQTQSPSKKSAVSGGCRNIDYGLYGKNEQFGGSSGSRSARDSDDSGVVVNLLDELKRKRPINTKSWFFLKVHDVFLVF